MWKCANAEIDTTLDAGIACGQSCAKDHCDEGNKISVATNLENLEYSGISLNMENSANSWEFCATWGKNCNKQSIFSSSFKYLCTTAVGKLGKH